MQLQWVKLNEMKQECLVYPDDVIWLGQKIHALKKKTQTLSVTSEEVSRENVRLSGF